jgi:putative ATP-dependent endonuclease of OLD family
LREVHLYDREQQPETDVRLRAVAQVNARPGCHAALTSKRCLENYLHPLAIAAAGGSELDFGDDDSVSLLLARHRYEQSSPSLSWDCLARRSQRRLSAQAKRWLNRLAVEHMTAALLADRDPAGELLGWLQIIQELVPGAG